MKNVGISRLGILATGVVLLLMLIGLWVMLREVFESTRSFNPGDALASIILHRASG